MSRHIAIALALGLTALVAAPAAASGGKTAETMVIGRTKTLKAAHAIGLSAKSATVTIGHRRCKVPARTPLSALLATHLKVTVTDAAGCDPASMFVRSIGGERNRGAAGWEYKVGHKDPSLGAADPAGRLRAGQQLLWYWCVRAGGCQRTLSLTSAFMGNTLQVHVLGYDENGHAKSIAGATVHYGAQTQLTDQGGHAGFTTVPGQKTLKATKAGLVPSFPTAVGVVP